MEKSTIDLNTPEGKKLIRNLHVYAYLRFRRVYKTEINERGKSFADYVSEAIEKHIKGEDNYDPNRSPLEYHLKENVIKQSIYNDLPPYAKKNKGNPSNDLGLGSNFTQLRTKIAEPSVEANIPSLIELDEKVIFGEIEKSIEGDNVLEQIYLAVCQDNFEFSDREAICSEYGMSLQEFHNGKRRFMTVVTKVLKKLNLT